MKAIFVYALRLVLLFGIGLQSAIADTEVSGNITSDTTWAVAGSPYIVVGTVQVLDVATLTIEPGVTVKFNEGLSLMIGGELIARGTATDSILFTSNNATPQPGDWGSIKFIDTSVDAVLDSLGNYVSGCIIEYCRIEYGGDIPNSGDDGAIHCEYASPFISHNAIIQNIAFGDQGSGKGGGIYCYYSSSTIVDNLIADNTVSASDYPQGGGIYYYGGAPCSLAVIGNTIIGNTVSASGDYEDPGYSKGGGIYCCSSNSVVNITGNNISGNSAQCDGHYSYGYGGGIYLGDCYVATVADNTIRGNSVSAAAAAHGGGIYCYGYSGSYFPAIIGNTIIGNIAHGTERFSHPQAGGIYCNDYASPSIIYNNITGNSAYASGSYGGFTGGIHCNDHSCPIINYNNLVNHCKYEISLWDVLGNNNVDATNNWWGTTDVATIQARIYDHRDNWDLAYVLYEPFLTSPAIGEPDSVYSVVLKSDETYTTDLTTDLWIGATMYIQLEGKDGGCASIDHTTVTVTSSLTDTTGIVVTLTETDTTSGIFRGTALIDSLSVEGVSIGAGVGETITITSDVDSTKLTTVGVVEVGINGGHIIRTPQAFSLSQNYPNPFNPTTQIEYALPRDARVRLEIYNLLGQKVATLVDEYQRAGYRSVRWDARGLASGVYLYRLQAGDFTAVKKLVVIK